MLQNILKPLLEDKLLVNLVIAFAVLGMIDTFWYKPKVAEEERLEAEHRERCTEIARELIQSGGTNYYREFEVGGALFSCKGKVPNFG
ncbi:MAG: hypothetical protein AAF465_13680 [Pseudomonadota bacterium]